MNRRKNTFPGRVNGISTDKSTDKRSNLTTENALPKLTLKDLIDELEILFEEHTPYEEIQRWLASQGVIISTQKIEKIDKNLREHYQQVLQKLKDTRTRSKPE